MVDSIRGSFMTKSDLSAVEGFNVGAKGQPDHLLARSFMDRSAPVSMNDGSPKELPPGVTSVSQIESMSPQQLNSRYGLGAGNYFSEIIFWNRHKGILLGKQKWEAEGHLQNDKAKLGECWDLRWLCKSPADARAFHENMLSACRAERNNGYLDGQPELSLKPGERASLPSGIDRESLVFFGNKPKKMPSTPTSQLAMRGDPTPYLQQYGIVFVIGRMVVKLWVIQGFNPVYGKLKRSSMFGDSGLLNIAVKVITKWLAAEDGTATAAADPPIDLPKLGDVSACAKCGNKPKTLRACSRCKQAAYCNQDCQVADYKQHRKPCKEIALAKEKSNE